MKDEKLELMVNEIITFLKKKELWETDTTIHVNGFRYHHEGIAPSNIELKGIAYMWFEGPLNWALNHGLNDPKYKVYNGLKAIMEKHGCYPEFGSHCDFNIYPI